MKPGNSQFGMRENTASSRQHAPRVAVQSVVARSPRFSVAAQDDLPALSASSSQESATRSLNNAAYTAATEGDTRRDERLLTVREVAELMRVPVSWVYDRTRRRGAEQLPHIKLGKYLRFEEALVQEFIQRQRRA